MPLFYTDTQSDLLVTRQYFMKNLKYAMFLFFYGDEGMDGLAEQSFFYSVYMEPSALPYQAKKKKLFIYYIFLN